MTGDTNDESKSTSKSPGPFITKINHLLHQEPVSSLFRSIFWFFVLVFVSPIVGTFLFFRTIFLYVSFLRSSKDTIDAKTDLKELAVFITGCDTGFGQLLSFVLEKRGFVVFAGCLTEDGMGQFRGNTSIHPIRVDVTKDDDVTNASIAVSKWLRDSTSDKPRALHAVINNAGIGVGGLVDWIPISNYKRCMDVNYFGVIRTVKAFLPILKEQSSTNSYSSARIINMVSMAGLGTAPGSSPYFCSKHAVEAFSSCLRIEMLSFGVKVITFNPSFHVTEIVKNQGPNLRKDWDKLDSKIKKEYGQKYFEQMFQNSNDAMIRLGWDAANVKEKLVESIESSTPDPQVIVGSDAKYGFLLFRFLPAQFQGMLFRLQPLGPPAKMIQS